MMNHMKALAILAFCYKIEAAALPQLGPALSVAIPAILPAVTEVSIPVSSMSSSFFPCSSRLKNQL
jgi:hypothetical protein